jgi:hypothetical protein
MRAQDIFIGPVGLRSGWRLLIFLAIVIALQVLIGRVAAVILTARGIVGVGEVDDLPAGSICGGSFSFDTFSTHKVNRYNVDQTRLLQFDLPICELPPQPLKQRLRLLPTTDRFLGSSPTASHATQDRRALD